MKNSAILLLKCPDRKGLDAAIADFIYWHGGDILHFEQHQAGHERFYLARVEWDLTGFEFDLKDFPQWFKPIADQFSIEWRITTSITGRAWRFSSRNTIIASSIFCIGNGSGNLLARFP